MYDLIRDSSVGQTIRYLTGNKYLLYADEREDFHHPDYHHHHQQQQQQQQQHNTDLSTYIVHESSSSSLSQTPTTTISTDKEDVERGEDQILNDLRNPVERLVTQQSQHAVEKMQSLIIHPTRTANGVLIVDWYSTDDPDNPANWSSWKKVFVAFQICLYTFTVYIGSSIYSGSQPAVVERFGVSVEASTLGLALYVLAYGTGPLLFSPLSEIPAIGRNPPYILTLIVFAVLWVPTALVDNFGGLLALRFLTGFFGSPCLATGGASFQDIYAVIKVPYLLALWASAATLGPSLGPIISSFSVQAESWRWASWEMLWLSAPVCMLLTFCLPETSSATILYRRAKRLQHATTDGNPQYKSRSEIEQTNLTSPKQIVYDALIKPTQINLLDPAVLFSTLYTGLVYGIYYSFFESFPLVYGEIYGFGLAVSSLPFLAVLVGLLVAAPVYVLYWYLCVDQPVQRKGGIIEALGSSEDRLVPGLFVCWAIPAGLFLFAWTATPSVHFMATMAGLALTVTGIFIILQCIFMFLAFTYPKYGASLFAANDFARSTMAAGSILVSRPMFLRLGIGWGVSLLAFLTVVCCVLLFALWNWGAQLRKRSRFAETSFSF